jgi:hypothetical protein
VRSAEVTVPSAFFLLFPFSFFFFQVKERKTTRQFPYPVLIWPIGYLSVWRLNFFFCGVLCV